jgi:hypothetical protein
MGKKKIRPPQPPDEPQGTPQPGSAGPGESINPMGLPEEPADSAEQQRVRPCPAPGVPVSPEEYERLKEKAKSEPKEPVNAQEDPSKKK